MRKGNEPWSGKRDRRREHGRRSRSSEARRGRARGGDESRKAR